MADKPKARGESDNEREIRGRLRRPRALQPKRPETPASESPAGPPAEKTARTTGGLPIGVTLSIGFGGLVAVAVGVVLYLALVTGRDTSLAVIGDRAVTILDTIEERVEHHLAPAAEQGAVLARRLASGELGFENMVQLADFMTAMMSGTRQVGGTIVIGPNLESLRVVRVEDRFQIEISSAPENSPIAGAVADIALREDGYWGDVVWAPLAGKSVINHRQPVRVDGTFRYAVFSAITIGDLSAFLADTGAGSGNIFILYGDDKVLAHPALIDGAIALNADKPLPSIAEVGDPILNLSWLGDGRREALPAPGDWRGLLGHTVGDGDSRHVVLYRDVAGYGPSPWRIGATFPMANLAGNLQRLLNAAIAGLIVMAIAIVLAILLGRYVSRPVRDLAAAARTVGEFDLDNVPPIGPSAFRETRDAANAFNVMLGGLKAFGIYMPRSLVRRLIRQGNIATLRSETRQVTVLFTDIVAFTTLAEGRRAAEIADFLNQHFTLLTAEIEKTGGTVDKYIGDSVMAFWGAPERQPDHAERAAACASAIARAVARDNAARAEKGLPPVRIRIGIHSGPAIVGNVGGPTRVDYTLVGDTVNIASRLNDLARKYLDGDSPAVAIISGETANALPGEAPVIELGEVELRGRAGEVRICKLDVSE